VSAGEERYRYHYPVWLGLIGGLLFYLFLPIDPTAPVGVLVIFWLVSGAGLLILVGTVASHVRRVDVVLTEHDVTGAAPLRRAVRIDFAAVEKLAYREIWSRGGQRYGILEVHVPGRRLMLWDKAFRDRETFEQMVETVAARVAANGGPELDDRPAFRRGAPFVA